MNHRIKAVFADIDGTIYSHTDGRIPDSAFKAIEKAQKAGIPVFAATGRHRMEIEDLHIEIPLDGWITMNGALSYSHKGIFDSHPLHKNDLKALLEGLEKDPFPVQFMEEDRMYINLFDEDVNRSLQKIHTPYPEILDPAGCLEHDTYMVIPWVTEERWAPVSERMLHAKGTRWTDLAVDVMSSDSGKANGVLAACRMLGIDPKDTCAIGDGPNDIELFDACGFSIAMGNSSEEVKRKADAVTDHIDNDGFAKAFADYIFQQGG